MNFCERGGQEPSVARISTDLGTLLSVCSSHRTKSMASKAAPHTVAHSSPAQSSEKTEPTGFGRGAPVSPRHTGRGTPHACQGVVSSFRENKAPTDTGGKPTHYIATSGHLVPMSSTLPWARCVCASRPYCPLFSLLLVRVRDAIAEIDEAHDGRARTF